MLPVTIDSTACYLLACEEAWMKSITGEFSARSGVVAGLSGMENRRAFASETILTLSFSAYFEGAAAALFRGALRSYNNEPVLAPFWPADGLLSDLASCRWSGGLRCFYEPGFTAWQVRAGASAPDSFVPTAECRVVPLLWGRFEKLPQPESAVGDEAMTADLTITEEGPAAYAIRPAGVTLLDGPSVGARTPRLLSVLPDWTGGVSSGGVDLRIAREQIGYGRSEATEYVPQAARRRQKLNVTAIDGEAAELVALFREAGASGSFWSVGAFADTRLASGITSGAVIQVLDASPLTGVDAIGLVSGSTFAARRIVSRNGAALTLQSAPGVFPTGTAVCPLLLSRFAGSKLKLTWSNPALATATLEVIEVPTETAVPAGETVGSTIGDIGAPCWLYLVADGDLTWRFTSYESALNAGALGTFTPVVIDHGDITSELNLQRHDVDITVGWFAGSPFERARLDRLAPPLTVQIYEGAVANPSAAELIFTGKAAGYRFGGGTCTCKIAGPTALFDIRGPVAVTSPRCWTPMYSPLCGLSRAAMSMPAQLVAASGNDFHFELSGAPAIPLDYFRFGYAERTAAGETRRWPIVGSDVLGSAVTLPTLPGTLQTETSAWVTAATSAGGSLTDTTKAIADALIVALKASTAWPKLGYLLPFLGSNLAAGLTPLHDPHSFGRPTNNAFVDDDFSERTGLRGDGVTKTLVAPFSPHELGTGDNAGLGVWPTRLDTRTGAGGTSGVLGFRDTTEGEKQYSIVGSPTVPFRFRYGPVPAGDAISSTTACQHYYGQRSSATARTLYASGVEAAANSASVSITTGGGGVGTSFRPGLMGLQSNASDTVPYWAGTTALVYATDGTLTPAEIAELHAIFRDYLMVPTYRLTSAERVTLSPAPSVPATLPESGWTLVPGCGHSWSDCRARGNSDNFRGFPHFPKSNPAMVSVKQDTPSTSKK